MRKSALVRAVYAQLRLMHGDELAAGDLIRLAHFAVEAFSDPTDELAQFGVARKGARPFLWLAVDEAMADGGWRVLNFERKRGSSWTDRGDPSEKARFSSIVGRYLGDWQQVNWRGYGFVERE